MQANCQILNTQTPAQIKKHAECFFQQKLKTNSAAVKQYWESLSPDKKAQILITNVAEQKNYRQSLSPEKKTQILCNNAEGHRKPRKDLPPKKKIKILQTDADAHNIKWESLSPEDKELFDKNNAAALKKHCKSLTPDQKAQEIEKMLSSMKNIENLSFLNKKLKLSQSMQLHTKYNMNCFPRRKKQDSKRKFGFHKKYVLASKLFLENKETE